MVTLPLAGVLGCLQTSLRLLPAPCLSQCEILCSALQENILVTNSGAVKLIDFGAAVDMCTGINFNPSAGMLDPRQVPSSSLDDRRRVPAAAVRQMMSWQELDNWQLKDC